MHSGISSSFDSAEQTYSTSQTLVPNQLDGSRIVVSGGANLTLPNLNTVVAYLAGVSTGLIQVSNRTLSFTVVNTDGGLSSSVLNSADGLITPSAGSSGSVAHGAKAQFNVRVLPNATAGHFDSFP